MSFKYRLWTMFSVTSISLLLGTAASYADQSAWDNFMQAASAAKQKGQYAEAEKSLLSAIKDAESAAHNNIHLAASLFDLAKLYEGQFKFGEAEALYKRSLKLREQGLGPNHLDVAATLDALGYLHFSGMNSSQSEAYYRKALAVREKALGPDHPDVATNLQHIGYQCTNLRKFDDAEAVYKRSLAIREKAFGPESKEVCESLSCLRGNFMDAHDYIQAEEMCKKALAIAEKTSGPDSKEVAGCLASLADIYDRRDKKKEAEELYQRNLEIIEKTCGPDDPAVAEALTTYSHFLESMNHKAEAKKLGDRANAIRKGPAYLAMIKQNEALVRGGAPAGQLPQSTWQESAAQAQEALKSGNLDSAMNYLQQALPQAAKQGKAAASNRAELESLLATVDTWWHRSEAKDAEQMTTQANRVTTLHNLQTARGPASSAQLTSLGSSMTFIINKMPILQEAAALRKQLYGPQDKTAKSYDAVLMTPSAERIYVTCFVSPLSRISDLSGGGYAWMGSSLWVRFKSAAPAIALRTRFKASAQRPSLAETIKIFTELCPQDKGLFSDTRTLQAVHGTDSLDPRKRSTWVLLSNKQQHLYWFQAVTPE